MKLWAKLLYFACFAALAAVTALSVARVGRPSIAALLVWSAFAGVLAGAPGLVRRRAWPLALVLLPAGAYLLLRQQAPPPASVHGLWGQVAFYAGQLRAAAHAYTQHTFPFDLGDAPELKILLSTIVYGATGLAALAALSLRKALPAVAVFLVLLGFSLTVDGTGRVVLLPITFVFLAGCLLTLSRSLERRPWASAGVVAGAGTAVAALLLALTLAAATPVASGRPWQDWTTWGPIGQGSYHLAFDWMANFPSLLNPRTDARVMKVDSPVASYWRANVLDYFNGDAWFSRAGFGSRLTADGTPGSATYDVPPGDDPAPAGRTVTEIFKVQSLYTDFLFAGGAPRTLVLDRHVPVLTNDSLALRLVRTQGPDFSYGVTAVIPQITSSELVGRGRDYPPDTLPYTELPFPSAADMTGRSPQAQWKAAMSDTAADREWLGLYQLDRSIVKGATDPYQITLRIERYLRTAYTYSLTPPTTRYRSPYAAFLFATRTGYCQHFAGAMAILLRFNGIPARVAVGFTAGTLTGRDTFVVSRTDAHAWVEAYFPGVGWASFDPTPGRALPGAGPSSTNAGFVDPFPQDAGPGSVAASGAASPKLQSLPADPARRHVKGAGAVAPAPATNRDWLPWVAGLATLLVAWPFARALVRRRGVRRGEAGQRLRARLGLIYAELGDYGVGVPRSQTLQETSRFLEEYLDLDASALTARVEAVLFGGHPADDQVLADLARLQLDLGRRLRERQGWLNAVRARYGLRLAR